MLDRQPVDSGILTPAGRPNDEGGWIAWHRASIEKEPLFGLATLSHLPGLAVTLAC